MASFTLLNTRPVGQAEALNTLLNQAGGQGLSCPSIQIVPFDEPQFENTSFFDSAQTFSVESVLQADHWVFISVNAVNLFATHLNSIESQGLSRVVAGAGSINIHAIGQATALALQALGFNPNPASHAQYDSEGLLETEALQDLSHTKMLIFKGLGGRTALSSTFKARGAQVGGWSIYERQTAPWCPEVWQAFKAQPEPIILFSSLGGFESFKAQLLAHESPADWQWASQQPAIVFSQRILDFCRQSDWHGLLLVVPLQTDMGILQSIDLICERRAL